MTEQAGNVSIFKSYVFRGDECFFVSTMERESSAAAAYGARFNETMAWRFDWDNNKTMELVGHVGDGEAFRQHMAMCEQLYRTGRYAENGVDQ